MQTKLYLVKTGTRAYIYIYIYTHIQHIDMSSTNSKETLGGLKVKAISTPPPPPKNAARAQQLNKCMD